MYRNAREWRHGDGIAPLTFQKGSKGSMALFHYSIIGNYVINKIDLNQIYCSYSGTQKIQNDFL